jgi:hypothetical protein
MDNYNKVYVLPNSNSLIDVLFDKNRIAICGFLEFICHRYVSSAYYTTFNKVV